MAKAKKNGISQVSPLDFIKIYAAKLLLDEDYRQLDTTGRGILLGLICEQWNAEGSLPGNAKKLIKMLGCTPKQWSAWLKCCPNKMAVLEGPGSIAGATKAPIWSGEGSIEGRVGLRYVHTEWRLAEDAYLKAQEDGAKGGRASQRGKKENQIQDDDSDLEEDRVGRGTLKASFRGGKGSPNPLDRTNTGFKTGSDEDPRLGQDLDGTQNESPKTDPSDVLPPDRAAASNDAPAEVSPSGVGPSIGPSSSSCPPSSPTGVQEEQPTTVGWEPTGNGKGGFYQDEKSDEDLGSKEYRIWRENEAYTLFTDMRVITSWYAENFNTAPLRHWNVLCGYHTDLLPVNPTDPKTRRQWANMVDSHDRWYIRFQMAMLWVWHTKKLHSLKFAKNPKSLASFYGLMTTKGLNLAYEWADNLYCSGDKIWTERDGYGRVALRWADSDRSQVIGVHGLSWDQDNKVPKLFSSDEEELNVLLEGWTWKNPKA